MITEFLALFTENGEFIAGHLRDVGGVPRPITQESLPELINQVNSAIISQVDILTVQLKTATTQIESLMTVSENATRDAARVSELDTELTELKTEYTTFKNSVTSVAEAARAIIANENISPVDTCARVDAMAAEMLKNKIQRDRDAAIKARDEAQSLVDKLFESAS